jgi:hypothetical protein
VARRLPPPAAMIARYVPEELCSPNRLLEAGDRAAIVHPFHRSGILVIRSGSWSRNDRHPDHAGRPRSFRASSAKRIASIRRGIVGNWIDRGAVPEILENEKEPSVQRAIW